MDGTIPQQPGQLVGYGTLTARGDLLPGIIEPDRKPNRATIDSLDKYFKKDAPHTLVEIRVAVPA